ncbi:MAG: ferrochelatase [Acidobacteria bacterium]|nr:ferrochelatase [Acidobacteriota bacterium]
MPWNACPFDAVLLISFGGPLRRADIRPFLQNVLRGRRVPPARLEAVVQHYELFDGVSPLTAITRRQAEGLRARLAATGPKLPVFVGMRNWHPFLDDTLEEMAAAGIERALGIVLAAHHSYSSCGQYRQNVAQARQELRARAAADVEVLFAPGWHTHQGFVEANARRIDAARRQLPDAVRQAARIVFTAHSIPTAMAAACRYETDLRETAERVAARLETDDWVLAYQSRSGRPEDPWLEPDVCEYLRTAHERGLRAAVIAPIGFVADHIEVLYDLDTEAAEVCRDLGLPMRRAAAVNDHPAFIDTLADVTQRACEQARCRRPLPIVPASPPARLEPPPPAR